MAMHRDIERRESDRDFARKSLWRRIREIVLMDVPAPLLATDERAVETLEDRLLESDFGVPATLYLVEEVETAARNGKIPTDEAFRRFVRERVVSLLNGPAGDSAGADPPGGLARAATPPTVIVLVGVNGVGKTTTLARLARRLQARGEAPLLAAADTFRAGAIEQVRVWGERLGAPVVAGSPGGDPAAVVYDAIGAAEARGATAVLADTAGRLHTQGDLMEELAKLVRVAGHRKEGAPDETLLVLDATTGQNALAQARAFAARLPLTGIVVCKLDGTAKGGVVVAIQRELGLPVRFVGLGEGPDDLVEFDPERFAEGLLG